MFRAQIIILLACSKITKIMHHTESDLVATVAVAYDTALDNKLFQYKKYRPYLIKHIFDSLRCNP